MAASVVSVSGRLCSSSSSCLLVECSNAIDERSTSGGTLGFKKERPAAPLGRGAGPPSAALALGVLSCSTSYSSSRVAAAFATKQKQKGRSAILDVDGDEEQDDDPNGEVTEFADMEEWMRRKPPGFGLQKYDTSLEDSLLAEIEAEKAARAVMASKKKVKKPVKAANEKQDAPPQGVEVYVGNLPRKRNVDRDLRAGFRSAQGLLHVRPIVDANEKTREPVCKGLAFLTFASRKEAENFIRKYNGEELRFGKTVKSVVCELAAINSPFKKQASQKQGTDSPRLEIRETAPSPLCTRESPSLHMAGELVDTRDFSDSESSLNSESLEGQDEDIDFLDVSEDEMLELEQEIWVELEDKDDFEVDRELEEYDSDDPDVPLTVDNVTSPEARNHVVQDRPKLAQIDDSIHVREGENDVIIEGEVKEGEKCIQETESSPGRGFGLTPSGTPDAAAGDKDKRIQELESKLKQLEVQLKKSETKAEVRESTLQSEQKIEALEKRLLARATPAPKKDSRISTAKRVSGLKKPSSKVRSLSKMNPSRPKIGASKRLKTSQIFTSCGSVITFAWCFISLNGMKFRRNGDDDLKKYLFGNRAKTWNSAKLDLF